MAMLPEITSIRSLWAVSPEALILREDAKLMVGSSQRELSRGNATEGKAVGQIGNPPKLRGRFPLFPPQGAVAAGFTPTRDLVGMEPLAHEIPRTCRRYGYKEGVAARESAAWGAGKAPPGG